MKNIPEIVRNPILNQLGFKKYQQIIRAIQKIEFLVNQDEHKNQHNINQLTKKIEDITNQHNIKTVWPGIFPIFQFNNKFYDISQDL